MDAQQRKWYVQCSHFIDVVWSWTLVNVLSWRNKNQLTIITIQTKTNNDGNRTHKHVLINPKSVSNNVQYINRQFIGMNSMHFHGFQCLLDLMICKSLIFIFFTYKIIHFSKCNFFHPLSVVFCMIIINMMALC